MGNAEREQPIKQREQSGGGGGEGADVGRARAIFLHEAGTSDDGLLMDIKSGAMGMDQVHQQAPERCLQRRVAGKMPSVIETDMRVSRTRPGITKRCAVQHPGQTNVQALGTKKTPTLMPAVAGRMIADFHAAVCEIRMGG